MSMVIALAMVSIGKADPQESSLNPPPAVLVVEVVVVLDHLLREEHLLLSKVLAATSPPEEEGVEGGGEGEQVFPGELAGGLLLPLVDAQHLVLGDSVNDGWDDCSIGPE